MDVVDQRFGKSTALVSGQNAKLISPLNIAAANREIVAGPPNEAVTSTLRTDIGILKNSSCCPATLSHTNTGRSRSVDENTTVGRIAVHDCTRPPSIQVTAVKRLVVVNYHTQVEALISDCTRTPRHVINGRSQRIVLDGSHFERGYSHGGG